MSLFQSNLRKQIRNLPKILNFVKKIHYYCELFTSLLGIEYENATLTWEKRGSATEGGFLTLLFFDDSRADPSDMTPLCDPSNVKRAVYVNPGKGGWRSGVRGRGSLLIQTLEGLFCVVSIPLFANIFSARRVGREILQHWKSAYLVANSRK